MREVLLHGGNARPTGSLSFLIKGDHTTVGGHGEIFQTGKVSGYPGEGTKVVSIFDHNYNEAPLKLMRYDQSFKKMKAHVQQSNCFKLSCFHLLSAGTVDVD